MKRRILGGTGISVSEYALGHDDVRRHGQHRPRRLRTDHPPRAGRRHQLHRHRRRLLRGRVRGDRRQGAQGPARRRRAGHQVLQPDGDGRQPAAATPGGGSSGRSRTACAGWAPTTSTSTRCTAPIPRPTSTRRWPRSPTWYGPGKVRAVGCSTFPAEQIVEAQWAAERRGHVRFRTEQPPYSILARGIEAAVLPTAQRYGMGVLTWGPLSAGWLSGRRPVGQLAGPRLETQKFDLSVPENAGRRRRSTPLTQVAAEAGLSLPHLATAFVRAHPAVTSVIIGPRTLDQLDGLLDGAEVALSDGRTGPDRRDRATGHRPQPGGQLLPAAGPHRGVPAQALTHRPPTWAGLTPGAERRAARRPAAGPARA